MSHEFGPVAEPSHLFFYLFFRFCLWCWFCRFDLFFLISLIFFFVGLRFLLFFFSIHLFWFLFLKFNLTHIINFSDLPLSLFDLFVDIVVPAIFCFKGLESYHSFIIFVPLLIVRKDRRILNEISFELIIILVQGDVDLDAFSGLLSVEQFRRD